MCHPRGERAATAQQLTGRTGSDRAVNLQDSTAPAHRDFKANAQQLHCNRRNVFTFISVCIEDKNTDTCMRICIDLNQCICPCMCLYVYGIQANMNLIQLLCERRYMQIQAYTCRYINVCITYTSCMCDLNCVISCAYVFAYVTYMCFTYIHI
jgi:hypothetical protein